MATYVNPAKKNYFAVKAAVDKYAFTTTYGLLISALGGAAVLATLILSVVSASQITVEKAVTDVMKLLETKIKQLNLVQSKMHELMKKIIDNLR